MLLTLSLFLLMFMIRPMYVTRPAVLQPYLEYFQCDSIKQEEFIVCQCMELDNLYVRMILYTQRLYMLFVIKIIRTLFSSISIRHISTRAVLLYNSIGRTKNAAEQRDRCSMQMMKIPTQASHKMLHITPLRESKDPCYCKHIV